MIKKLFPTIFFICNLTAQPQIKDSLYLKNGIDSPSLLTTHHFGIFSSRIDHNFKIKPPRSTTFNLNIISGNNFHPFVETHLPEDPEVRQQLSEIIWHDRPFHFVDQETTPAAYMNIVIDAVIKAFPISINIPIAKHHELQLNLNSYLISAGKYPFSPLTGDEPIEWFHSNIAGGEDPFGRRYYGLNEVHFNYTDRYGKVLNLGKNDFFIGSIALNHFYYPKLAINKTKALFINFGSHLGINTSEFNASLDLGISTNVIKALKIKKGHALQFGAGYSILRKNLVNFKSVVDLGNNAYLGTFNSGVEMTKQTKRKNYNAFSINYQIQTSYNKKAEADYYKLYGKWKEINGGWHNGIATLYTALSNWSFVYTYGHPRYKLSLYFKEDFTVNNAPDFQTGIRLKIPLTRYGY